MKKLKAIGLTISLTFSFGLFSCSNVTEKEQTEEIRKIHERLIDCNTVFVMEDGEQADGYYQNHDNFIKEYFSEAQSGDTLIVTTLMKVNACGKTIGDIEFSGDTLFLKTRQISDEVCASVVYEKFTYRIYNPEKKKYQIESEE
ncbi:MAG: hypothetical protein JNK41_09590 [Saprospiraceae bacterium]|nr:hypothetical protein [Saprospiraceae bacterium]